MPTPPEPGITARILAMFATTTARLVAVTKDGDDLVEPVSGTDLFWFFPARGEAPGTCVWELAPLKEMVGADASRFAPVYLTRLAFSILSGGKMVDTGVQFGGRVYRIQMRAAYLLDTTKSQHYIASPVEII